MRFLPGGRRLCALGLMLVSAPLLAAETSIEVHAAEPVPEALWFAPEGALDDDKRWLELPRVLPAEGSSYAARYRADLPAGSYRLVAFRPAGVDKRSAHLPLRSPTPDGERIVVADAPLDLGRVELLGPSLGLTLVYRGEAAAGSGWAASASGEATHAFVQRMRDAVHWLTPPMQSTDGAWSTLVSGNRLAVRQEGGAWTVHSVLAGGRTTAHHLVDAGQAVVAGELGRLEWLVFGQPAQPLATAGWPDGQADFIRCDAAKRCVVSIRSGDSFHLLHSADAATGPWKRLAEMPAGKCVWTCTQTPTVMMIGDEVVAVGGKHDLWRVKLADGSFGHEVLPFRVTSASAGGGRLVVGKRYSLDAGRTWKEGELGRLNQALQFDDQGQTFAIGWDRKLSRVRPVLRQSAPGSDTWTSLGVLPVTGGQVALGQALQTLYFSQGQHLWSSVDRGRTWVADSGFYQALAAAGAK